MRDSDILGFRLAKWTVFKSRRPSYHGTTAKYMGPIIFVV